MGSYRFLSTLSPTETREIAKPGLSLSMINFSFKWQVKITLLLTKINIIWSIWPLEDCTDLGLPGSRENTLLVCQQQSLTHPTPGHDTISINAWSHRILEVRRDLWRSSKIEDL